MKKCVLLTGGLEVSFNIDCDGNISIMMNTSDQNTTAANISNKWTLSYKPGIYADVTNWLWKIVPPVVIIVVTFGNYGSFAPGEKKITNSSLFTITSIF